MWLIDSDSANGFSWESLQSHVERAALALLFGRKIGLNHTVRLFLNQIRPNQGALCFQLQYIAWSTGRSLNHTLKYLTLHWQASLCVTVCCCAREKQFIERFWTWKCARYTNRTCMCLFAIFLWLSPPQSIPHLKINQSFREDFFHIEFQGISFP